MPRLSVRHTDRELTLLAHFSRLDLFSGWPRAVCSLRHEHRTRAAAANLHVGPVIVSTERLLLAESDLELAIETLARRFPRTLPWRADPRGLFWISVEGGEIAVEHGTAAGPTGRRWRGKSASALCRAILNEQLVALPEHAAYLGRELQRAEIAARLRSPFVQDAPLSLGRDSSAQREPPD